MITCDFLTICYYALKFGRFTAQAAKNIFHGFGEGSSNERNKPFIFLTNPHDTVRELVLDLGINLMAISRSLKLIGKVKKLDYWVPQEL